jgi:CHAD domain-containing protein
MRTLAHPRSLARRPVRALLAQWPLAMVDEVEGIHQARVASRRLRELVPAVARAADAREARTMRRGLRAVTRLLGRSRELDVAQETLQGIEARTPDHAVAVAVVRAHVVRARADAGQEVRAHLAGVVVNDLAAGTLALAGRSESPSAIRACARRVAARLGRRATELQKAVVDAGLIFAPGPLHGVRIALKKFRYSLEVAERLGRFRLTRSMQRLKRMQNLLGELHDLQVLGGLTRDVMAQAPVSRRSELESLVSSIDDEIRALHSQFLTERENIVALLARSNDVRRTLVKLPPPGRRATPGQAAARPAAAAQTRASRPTLEDS